MGVISVLFYFLFTGDGHVTFYRTSSLLSWDKEILKTYQYVEERHDASFDCLVSNCPNYSGEEFTFLKLNTHTPPPFRKVIVRSHDALRHVTYNYLYRCAGFGFSFGGTV